MSSLLRIPLNITHDLREITGLVEMARNMLEYLRITISMNNRRDIRHKAVRSAVYVQTEL